MFKPYRKLAKLSLNRDKLSCMSWKCIIFASRSATASDNSAKAGSKVLSGKEAASPCTLLRAESRNEERDEGRRGVVGREREVDRARR
jgi:formylglycine-generating enzyme required for sulfatase activity